MLSHHASKTCRSKATNRWLILWCPCIRSRRIVTVHDFRKSEISEFDKNVVMCVAADKDCKNQRLCAYGVGRRVNTVCGLDVSMNDRIPLVRRSSKRC